MTETEKAEFTYEIGGKKYTQSKLVLGQIEQLMPLMSTMLFAGDLNVIGVIAALGDKLSSAIAIVLKQEDQGLAEKDVGKLANEIKFEMEAEASMQVVEDFFFCNPMPSLLEKLGAMAEKITENVETGLKSLSPSSVEETSQRGKPSDGDSTSKSADLTSSTVTEK